MSTPALFRDKVGGVYFGAMTILTSERVHLSQVVTESGVADGTTLLQVGTNGGSRFCVRGYSFVVCGGGSRGAFGGRFSYLLGRVVM